MFLFVEAHSRVLGGTPRNTDNNAQRRMPTYFGAIGCFDHVSKNIHVLLHDTRDTNNDRHKSKHLLSKSLKPVVDVDYEPATTHTTIKTDRCLGQKEEKLNGPMYSPSLIARYRLT